MLDFKIQENLIITKDKILAIFILEPIDVFLLNSIQLNHFENNIRKVFNILKEDHIQILMRTRVSLPKDYKEHFKSIRLAWEKDKNIKENLVKEYIQNFTDFILKNNIPLKEYYLVFNTTFKGNNARKKVEAIKHLSRFVENIKNNLTEIDINIKHITNEDGVLEKLIKSFLRPHI